MTARDIYRFINEQDDNTMQRIIERLEFRGKDPTFRGWMEAYLNKLELTQSGQILMLGCGSGVEVRILAGRSDFSGNGNDDQGGQNGGLSKNKFKGIPKVVPPCAFFSAAAFQTIGYGNPVMVLHPDQMGQEDQKGNQSG